MSQRMWVRKHESGGAVEAIPAGELTGNSPAGEREAIVCSISRVLNKYAPATCKQTDARRLNTPRAKEKKKEG